MSKDATNPWDAASAPAQNTAPATDQSSSDPWSGTGSTSADNSSASPTPVVPMRGDRPPAAVVMMPQPAAMTG